MESLVSALNRDELDHVMAVLNRDRGLRDRDNERLVRLRMDLVREKRNGALVVGKSYPSDPNSRCARCLESLDLYDRWDKQKARCFLCKHLICKKCRVTKWRNEWEDENPPGKREESLERGGKRDSSADSIAPPAKSFADATTQTIISCDSDIIDASCPLCGSQRVNSSQRRRRRSASKDKADSKSKKKKKTAKSKTVKGQEVSSSLPNLRTETKTKSSKRKDSAGSSPKKSPSLESPVRRERRSNTFSGADNAEEKTPSYSFRDRRHSTSPKKEVQKTSVRSEVNQHGKVAQTLVQLAELHPVISRRKKISPNAESSFTKVEPRTQNPFEEGYEEPVSPQAKAKSARSASMRVESTQNPFFQSSVPTARRNSTRRRLSSDLRNPFINTEAEKDAKFKRISSVDAMNPFLNGDAEVTSAASENANVKISPVTANGASRKLSSNGADSPALSEVTSKSKNMSNLVTSKPPASPNPAAHRFLMMAGVTPPRNTNPPAQNTAPNKPFLTPNLSVTRKLDFSSSLKKSNSLTRSDGDRRRVSTESLLSSSFSDFKSSLSKFPSLSILTRKQQGEQHPPPIKEQTPEEKVVQESPKGKEDVEIADDGDDEDLEATSVVFKKMSDPKSDNESDNGSVTVTPSTENEDEDEEESDAGEDTSSVEVTASSTSSSDGESDVESEYEEEVENYAEDSHRLRVKSPIEEMLQRTKMEERKMAGRSLSESAVCAMLATALPLATQHRLAQEFGSAEDLAGSDYSSEVGSHATSDAMEADLDDSDVSPIRRSLYSKNVRRLQHQRQVDEVPEPPSRKSTRDSGYMTPDELKHRKSPVPRGTKALGPVERRAFRKQASDSSTSLVADFADGDRSDTESVKSDLSNASRLSLSTLEAIIFTNKQVPGFTPPEWICRVCFKTLEMQKKSGEWFRSAAKADTKKKYEQKPQRQPLTSAPPPVLARVRQRENLRPTPSTRLPKTSSLAPQTSKPVARSASAAHVRHRTYKPRSQSFHAEPLAARNPVYQSVTAEATKKRWIPADEKPPASEKIRAELAKIVPEPPQETSQHGLSQFAKKKSSLTSSSAKPAEITDGPHDCTVVKGNPISLCCALAGTPPLKVVWRKGRDEIRHSSQCNIESTRSLSALTIAKSERDDSGCYTLQVTNQSGVDQFSVSVKVVDIPDPPGKPFAQSATGDDIVVSWYGSGYDGGSSIKSYMLEVCKVWDNNSGNKVWNVVASTNSTSHTVKGLEKNATYIFRVSAENMYGVSKPGPASDVVRNLPAAMENGADSSEDEEDESTFVKYEPVKIRQNQKFSTKYEIHEKLGQGRFGKVHRVTDRETGKHYAAKIMRALKVKDKEAVSLEIEIMNKLRHPKLVQLIDAFSSGREITMVMDLVAGGELFERVIDEDFILTEAACIKYMRQICAGVRFMHNSNIVHLDLKPENIMCINKTGTQIKLIDFGLARKFNATDTVRVMFGTPEFVAPEVINYDAIGFQTDMWSVGVICYILLSGLSPFSGDADSETLSNITAVKWDFEDEAFDQISDEAKDFISHLLVKSLKNRYTVDKALQHRWLKNDVKKMSKSQLNTKNLKRFLARRKWQKTGNAVRALGRLASLARLPTSTSGATNGQRESGFLSALKAQLVREKESGESQEKRKPEFVRTFDDVEVVAGSAAKFECRITGSPDPEIAWYIDGKPIKESRHFRISYTEDDVCTLLITEAGPQDEAEFTCKAMNSEGAVEHSAELIVITPGV